MPLMQDKLPREQVKGFLEGLRRHLQSNLPDGSSITLRVASLLSGNGSQVWERKPEGPEAAFIGEYVLPNLEEFVRLQVNDRPRDGDPLDLIRVGFSAPKKYSSRGFAFFPGHPFGKVFRKPEAIYERWRAGEKERVPLIQSWPDLTLLSPYRILFECKYFKTRLKSPAKVQLVKDLYETFFYRSLPLQPRKGEEGQVWDYEFACYLAYDATEEGWLIQAWNGLNEKVRNSFWEMANVCVMILPER